eukprot:scaffold32096_cov48-Phaeocystis_antarctica.AAC.1
MPDASSPHPLTLAGLHWEDDTARGALFPKRLSACRVGLYLGSHAHLLLYMSIAAAIILNPELFLQHAAFHVPNPKKIKEWSFVCTLQVPACRLRAVDSWSMRWL